MEQLLLAGDIGCFTDLLTNIKRKLATEQKLGVVATARNWSTVTKLLELADT